MTDEEKEMDVRELRQEYIQTELEYAELKIKYAELKMQTEKMKCCGNCKNYIQNNNYVVGLCCLQDSIEGNNICDNWELAEMTDKEKIEITEVLKDKDRQLNNWYLSYNEVLKENAELRAQIEQLKKMQNCMNCSHCSIDESWHLYCDSDEHISFNSQYCESWKLKE